MLRVKHMLKNLQINRTCQNYFVDFWSITLVRSDLKIISLFEKVLSNSLDL